MLTENPNISVEQFAKDVLGVDRTSFQKRFMTEQHVGATHLRQLAEDCCRDYDRRCDLSEEPSNPSRSKPGFPSFSQIAHEEVYGHYDDARCLGFTGDRGEWAVMVYETRPKEREKLYAHSPTR